MPPVRVLSFHAGYRCRHAGACCTSDWPIPIEADRLAHLRATLAMGQLRPASGQPASAIDGPLGAPADTPAWLGRSQQRCVFYDDGPAATGANCRIQSALGHHALPLACRQFPRVSVHDARGISVTLSHYCPTAAATLDEDLATPAAIMADTGTFPATGEYVGLDARGALPPLLRENLLMDWESWWACERLAVELFAMGEDVTSALARLRLAVGDVETWSPVDGPLIERVTAAFALARSQHRSTAPPDGARLMETVFASIPAGVRPARFQSVERPNHLAARRFLAAHAFANWTMHLGTGIRVWLRSIEAAAALIDAGAGVRHADLLLRHLVEPRDLARALGALS